MRSIRNRVRNRHDKSLEHIGCLRGRKNGNDVYRPSILGLAAVCISLLAPRFAHCTTYTYSVVAEALNQQTPVLGTLFLVVGTPVINDSGDVAFGGYTWCVPMNIDGACLSVWVSSGGTATPRIISAFQGTQQINPYSVTLNNKEQVDYLVGENIQGTSLAAAFRLQGLKNTQISSFSLPNYGAGDGILSNGSMLVFDLSGAALVRNGTITTVGEGFVNSSNDLSVSPKGYWVYRGSNNGAKPGIYITDVKTNRSDFVNSDQSGVQAVNDNRQIAYYVHAYDGAQNEIYSLYLTQVGSKARPILLASVNNGHCYNNGEAPVSCTETQYGNVAISPTGQVALSVTQTNYPAPGGQGSQTSIVAVNGDMSSGVVFPPGTTVGDCTYPGNGLQISQQSFNALGQIVALVVCGSTTDGQPNSAVMIATPSPANASNNGIGRLGSAER